MTLDTVDLRRPPAPATTETVDDLRRELAQLRSKLASQPVIEEAKGMMMSAFGLTAEQAFELLKVMSQNNNAKLRDIAEQIVDTWTADGPRPNYDAAVGFLLAVRGRLAAR